MTDMPQHLNEDGSVTREWLLGHAHPQSVELVTINRYRLGSDLTRRTSVAYNYTPAGGLRRDYGPGIDALRRFIRRNFPAARVVETWH